MNPYQASTDESGHTSLVGTGGLNIDSHDVFLYKKFFNHSLGNGMVFQCLLQLAKIWHDIHPVACILISNCCSARFASCLDSRNIPRMFCRWLWKHRLSSSQPWSSTGGFNSSETCQGHHRRWRVVFLLPRYRDTDVNDPCSPLIDAQVFFSVQLPNQKRLRSCPVDNIVAFFSTI